MKEKRSLSEMLEIARENVRKNPSIAGCDTKTVASRYLQFLQDEVGEVDAEVREQNAVYLTDELSDIAWVYVVLLALLEERGYIGLAEDVFEHGFQKYTERAPTLSEADAVLWNEVKEKQKTVLAKRHAEKYGLGL